MTKENIYETPKPSLKRPKLYRIDWRDFFHGLVMAFLGGTFTAFVDAAQMAMETGVSTAITTLFTIAHMKIHFYIGCISAVTYIVKKLGTNSNGKLLKRES